MLVWLCFHRFFPQLRGCILPIRPGNPQLEWALCAETQYSMFFFMWRVYPEPYVTCRFPSFQPRWFQGLIDTGSRCNQFFLSHQCCVQGAATWLKVKDVSGGSTSHELWHWNLTKLTPKPSLKLTASKFVPENLPFLLRQQVAGSDRLTTTFQEQTFIELGSGVTLWSSTSKECSMRSMHKIPTVCLVKFSNAIKVWLRRAWMQWFRLFTGVMLNSSLLEPEISSQSLGRLTNLTEKLMIY